MELSAKKNRLKQITDLKIAGSNDNKANIFIEIQSFHTQKGYYHDIPNPPSHHACIGLFRQNIR